MERYTKYIACLVFFNILSAHPARLGLKGGRDILSAKTEGEKIIIFQLLDLRGWFKQYTAYGLSSDSADIEGSDRAFATETRFGIGYSVNKYFSFAVGINFLADLLLTNNDVSIMQSPEYDPEHSPDKFSIGLGDINIILKASYPLTDMLTAGFSPFVGFPVGSDTVRLAKGEEGGSFRGYDGGYHTRFTSSKTYFGSLLLLSFYPEARIGLNSNIGIQTNRFGSNSSILLGGVGMEIFLGSFSTFLELTGERFTKQTAGYGDKAFWLNYGFRIGKEYGSSFVISGCSFLTDRTGIKKWSNIPYWKPNIGIDIAFGYTHTPVVKKEIPKGMIAGKVIDVETSSPLFATIIVSYDTIRREVKSDSVTGMFRIEDIPEGIVGIVAEANNYQKSSFTAAVKGGETTLHDFVLRKIEIPKGVFTGKVIDKKTNEPLYAKVSFVGSEVEPSFTDKSTGIFRIELKEGTYAVKIEAEGYIPIAKPVVIEKDRPTITDFALLKKGMTLVFRNIYFDIGKATLKRESFHVLDKIAEMLKENPKVIVEIGGHTDSSGSAKYNLKLSQARAEAVRNYLIEEHNILSERLVPKGYGEANPIASNETKEGRAKNRRVEFTILGVME